MKHEEALVLLLGRITFDKLTKVRIYHLIKNVVDWYEFLNVCIKKKLICLAYKNLVDLGLIQLLPMVIINNMQYHFEKNKEQNENFLQVSFELTTYFKDNDILAVPVKGLRFLNTIYCNEPGVRILNDIDFIASAKDQAKIRSFMKDSGYETYLIDNQDALCSTNTNIKNCFYIKFEDTNPYGKVRIDFDYSYSDKWIQLIQASANPAYEFLYLCNSFYEETHGKLKLYDFTSYNYIKLIDIREYCCKYLSTFSREDILLYADELDVRVQTLYTLDCLDSIYTYTFRI